MKNLIRNGFKRRAVRLFCFRKFMHAYLLSTLYGPIRLLQVYLFKIVDLYDLYN